MRNLLLPAVAGILLATSVTAAIAATDTGTIKKIDTKGDAITLDDGKVFILAEGTEAESLKIGDKVQVTYRVKGGKMLATKVLLTR